MKTYIKTQFNEIKEGDEVIIRCVDRDEIVGDHAYPRTVTEVQTFGLRTTAPIKGDNPNPKTYWDASKFDFFKLHDGELEFGKHGPTEDIILIDDTIWANLDDAVESLTGAIRVGDVEITGDETPPNIVWRYSDASHEGPPETVFINDIPYDKRPEDNTEPVKGCDDSDAPYDWSQHLTGTKLEADWNSDTDDDIIALKATLRYAEVLLNRIARRG